MLKYVKVLLDEESFRAFEKLPEGQRSAFVRACLRALAEGQLKWVPHGYVTGSGSEEKEVKHHEG